MTYGGYITELSQASKLISLGFEKILIRRAFFTNPTLIESISSVFGSQSIVLAFDMTKYTDSSSFGIYRSHHQLSLSSYTIRFLTILW